MDLTALLLPLSAGIVNERIETCEPVMCEVHSVRMDTYTRTQEHVLQKFGEHQSVRDTVCV
jgi:hypothetical protein